MQRDANQSNSGGLGYLSPYKQTTYNSVNRSQLMTM